MVLYFKDSTTALQVLIEKSKSDLIKGVNAWTEDYIRAPNITHDQFYVGQVFHLLNNEGRLAGCPLRGWGRCGIQEGSFLFTAVSRADNVLRQLGM